MKQQHLTPAFIRLFANAYVRAKREAAEPKEVILSLADKTRLLQKPDNWRTTIYWLDQSSPIKFIFK